MRLKICLAFLFHCATLLILQHALLNLWLLFLFLSQKGLYLLRLFLANVLNNEFLLLCFQPAYLFQQYLSQFFPFAFQFEQPFWQTWCAILLCLCQYHLDLLQSFSKFQACLQKSSFVLQKNQHHFPQKDFQ